MKKRLFLMGLMGFMCVMGAMAQVMDIPLNESGGYEKKEVVEVAGATAADLYVRAMEALSDWKGPDGKAEAGLDFHDKDAGIVNYKGKFSLGYKANLFGGTWFRYADFTMKVRCKDGKAQVTVTVPTIMAVNAKTGQKTQPTVGVWMDAVKKSSGAKYERGVDMMNDLKETTDMLVEAMTNRLKNGSGDDDF
jgi:hypothetical protein